MFFSILAKIMWTPWQYTTYLLDYLTIIIIYFIDNYYYSLLFFFDNHAVRHLIQQMNLSKIKLSVEI